MEGAMTSAEVRYLRAFAGASSELYIYGAGKYARIYAEILEECALPLKGFIVSSEEHETAYLGLPVFSAHEIQLTEHMRVIAGFRGARLDDLEIHGLCEKQCLFLTEGAFRRLNVAVFLRRPLQELAKRHPPGQLASEKILAKNILILRLDVIGDLLFTVPFLRELRRNYPDAHITFVVWEKMYDMMRDCPYVDEVLPYACRLREGDLLPQFEEWEETCRRVRAFVDEHLSEQNYEAVFLPRSLLSGRNCVDEFVMALMSGATYRVGRFDDFFLPYHALLRSDLEQWMSRLYIEMEPKHEVEYMMDLLRLCGCHVADGKMSYWLSQEAKTFAERLVSRWPGWRYIACGIAGRNDASRCWPPRKYGELVHRFDGERVKFLLLGDQSTAAAAGQIGAGKNIVDLTGKTSLSQVAAVISLCDLYVGSDTGLMHFASAAGTPVVELSVWLRGGDLTAGWAPHRMGPWGVPSHVLLSECDGGPCRQELDSHAEGVGLITVDAVEQAVRDILKKHAHK